MRVNESKFIKHNIELISGKRAKFHFIGKFQSIQAAYDKLARCMFDMPAAF